jgi:hypothetical protein
VFPRDDQGTQAIATSSTSHSTGDLLDGTFAFATGVGIVTMALFPLAIPAAALTAVALVPLLLISLAAGLVVAPFLLLRRLFRRTDIPVPVQGELDGT